MSEEIKEIKKDLQETVDLLKELNKDDLLKTYGFALGLCAKDTAKES